MNPSIIENKSKPNYKKTPVGIIPEDWEVRRLKEIGSFHKGKRIFSRYLKNWKYVLQRNY